MSTTTTISVESCPICGADERVALFVGHDRLHDLPGHFPTARCIACGSAYLIERPVDLSVYYPPESYAAYNGTASHYSRAPGRAQGLAQRRRLLEILKPSGGRLLDIGCGSGDFLAVMQSVPGWQVRGLEPSLGAVRYARETRALDVECGTLPQLDWPSATYDAITMWHVLEHMPTPATILAEVRRLLTPDGIMVVAVPVADSAEANLFGETWAGYDVPRHLMTLTRASLTRLLVSADFKLKECFGVVQGLASLRLSLEWWLAEKNVWPRLRSLFVILGLPSLYVYLRLQDGRRTSVAVFAAWKSERA